jgi:hypothetical protein
MTQWHIACPLPSTPAAARGLEELFSAVLERFLQPRHSGCLRSKPEEVAGLYNGVTIIIETNNPRLKVRRNAEYFVS